MWLLKQKKKEIEKDIAKLEKKLEKINAKIAKKEEKRLAKKADELETNVAPTASATNEPAEYQKVESSNIAIEEEPKTEVKEVAKSAPKAKKPAAKKPAAKKPATKPAATATKKPAAKKATVAKKPAAKKEEEPVSSSKTYYHVGFDEENKKWVIKKAGAKRVIASFKTKEEALDRAKTLTKNNGAKLSVQRKDGKFGKVY